MAQWMRSDRKNPRLRETGVTIRHHYNLVVRMKEMAPSFHSMRSMEEAN